MTATFSRSAFAREPVQGGLRFGSVGSPDGWSVQWLLKRNCSLAPGQMFGAVAALCAVSLAIGVFFWCQGAFLVMPFTGLEVLAVAAASLLYARHATDCECIQLRSGSLVVEQASGRHVERVEFAADRVRVEPQFGRRSLIELSGQGRRIRIGRFVRPELRRQLADELRGALRRGHGPACPAPTAAPADNTGI